MTSGSSDSPADNEKEEHADESRHGMWAFFTNNNNANLIKISHQVLKINSWDVERGRQGELLAEIDAKLAWEAVKSLFFCQ
ncbi:MAG: hypothetical protein J6X49_17210 [Victivallales bacterium]|nr:hypothetical protein [Victivallales bacterium]